MIEIVQFKPEHLMALKLQATQATAQPLMNLEHGRMLREQRGFAETALLDGEPLACAGVIEMWAGRAYAWAYLGELAGKHFRAVHRGVLSTIDRLPWRRIEMAVDVRDPGAKNWAWHLGFSFEGVARKWTTDGRDVEIWARVT